MKVALIIESLKEGGAERTVSNLSLAMQAEHDVSVVLFDATEINYPHGGNLVDLNLASKPSIIGKVTNIIKRTHSLKKLFKKEKFDAVYAFMESAGLPSALASRESIASVRDNPASLPRIYHPLIPKIYPRAKQVVACAKAVEDSLNNNFGLTNTCTIYNAIDIDKAAKLSVEAIEEEGDFILAVGRLDKQKGFDYLIEAFAASKAATDTKLVILGEGKERANLEALISKHQLMGKAILKGATANPFAYYSKAKMFVLSSRHEGFPNILIEALACNCPSIAFDCPTGPSEIIQHEENGLLIEAENTAELTNAIDRLYGDKLLQQKFKANAKASVSHLSPQNITRQWLSLAD